MSWRDIQRENFTSPKKLADYLGIEVATPTRFPLNLPKRLAEKIEKGNPNDPILLQFLPVEEENEIIPGFTADPVGDCASKQSESLLQKYHGRALLITTGACAMHCRYCFRQEFPYVKANVKPLYIDSSIKEVILSGGDPLSLSDRALKELLDELNAISHLELIRFHTRFPIGIPERISHEFLSLLENSTKQIVFVIHANHPRELDTDVLHSCKEVQKLGIPVLCQSVLLKGINDSVAVLEELCMKLIRNGIIPYYLHQLDRVSGAHRFEVDESEGTALVKALREKLPGYAMPRYVKEITGKASKTLIS